MVLKAAAIADGLISPRKGDQLLYFSEAEQTAYLAGSGKSLSTSGL
jgi:hypothetical protein